MAFGRRPKIEIKTPEQLERMRVAGLVVARTLARLAEAVAPGVTTAELDRISATSIRDEGATPSFLGYHGFPATICTSVNEEVVHGIPGPRVLRDGDLISIDCGAIVDGWHGDAAISVPVGEIADDVVRLSALTEASLWAGISAVRIGGHISDVGHAVESHVRSFGGPAYGILEEYVGHGIGTAMHLAPDVPNYGLAGHGPVMEAGLAIAIEPMVTLGKRHVHTLDDDWTVVTNDGRYAAHWEHTVAVTSSGPWVLTALDGGTSRLASPSSSVVSPDSIA